MIISIRENTETNEAVMSVNGTVEFHNVNKFKAAFIPLLDKKIAHLVIDFSEIAYIDSSALGVLAIIYKKMKEYNGTITMTNVSDEVLTLLKISTLDRLITIH